MKKISLSVILIFMVIPLFAHPHMYIESRFAVLGENRKTTGIRFHWTFDTGFTEMILESYDANGDRAIQKNESNRIEKEAFANIETFHWFTRLFWEGKEIKTLQKPRDFIANIVGDNLVYEFTILLERTISTNGSKLEILQYDETFYVDMAFSKKPLYYQGRFPQLTVGEFTLKKEKKFAYWEKTISPFLFSTLLMP